MEYTFEKLPAPEQIQKLFASVNWESAQYPEALVRGISQSPVSYTHLTLPTICSV